MLPENVILILRKLSSEELVDLERTTVKQILYAADDLVPATVLEKYPSQKIALTPDELKRITLDTFNEVLHFCHTRKGDTLPIELFEHQKINYWYYIRFKVYVDYRQLVTDHELFVKMLAQTNPGEKIRIYGPGSLHTKTSPLPANVTLVKPVYRKPSIFKTLSEKSVYLTTVFLRALFTLLKFPAFFAYRKRHLLMYDNRIKNDVLSLAGKMEKGDHNIFYLLEKTANKKNFFYGSIVAPPGSTVKLKQEFRWKVVFNPWHKSWNHEFFLALAACNPFLYSQSKKLKKQVDSLKQLPVTGVSDELLTRAVTSCAKVARLAVFYQRASSSFVKTFKPLSVTVVGEHNMVMMSMINAGSLQNIKTNAFQHGVMHALHPHYVFLPQDHDHFRFATTTHVWGAYWKNQLLNQHYPENFVRVSGQMRTDCITATTKIKKSEVVKGLSDDKKVILYIGFPSRVERVQLRLQIITDILRVAGENKDTELIIKPHPNEDDYDTFHGLAKENGVTNYRILQHDLFLLLMIADVVVVYHSTVGSEAIMFKKPLVEMDYDNTDMMGYISSGVAFEARNQQELKTAVEGLLTGKTPLVNDDVIKRYAYDNNYLVDGKRTDEVIAFIEAGQRPST